MSWAGRAAEWGVARRRAGSGSCIACHPMPLSVYAVRNPSISVDGVGWGLRRTGQPGECHDCDVKLAPGVLQVRLLVEKETVGQYLGKHLYSKDPQVDPLAHLRWSGVGWVGVAMRVELGWREHLHSGT